MTSTLDIPARLGDVRTKVTEAVRSAEADRGGSPVTVAVVREFDAKADKAMAAADGPGARDAVIELEQAADSARAAAGADTGLGATARDAVEAAHLAICILKTEV